MNTLRMCQEQQNDTLGTAIDIAELVESMTVKQLKQFAEDNKIDIIGATLKADLLNKIKEAQ